MNRHHEGVSCDSCLQNSFRGRRYKCLICYDFDLCASCYEAGVTKQPHTSEHPMQCILPRGDVNLYFGGETLANPEQPQSFTCPYCSQMGFTLPKLLTHAVRNHLNCTNEVLCPVCVTTPGGDPNRATDNLCRHITRDHHIFPLLDEGRPIRVQDMRRLTQASPPRGRGRPRRANFQLNSVSLTAQAAVSQDQVDPISDLLLHLNTARRSPSNTSSTIVRLPSLRTNWQMDRVFAAQQLEQLAYYEARNLSNAESRAILDRAVAVPLPESPPPSLEPASSFVLPILLDEQPLIGEEHMQPLRSQFVKQLVISSITHAQSEGNTMEDDQDDAASDVKQPQDKTDKSKNE